MKKCLGVAAMEAATDERKKVGSVSDFLECDFYVWHEGACVGKCNT